MNIIVVDDDRLVAISLKTILEASGKVEVAAIGYSGREAMELYKKHLFFLLIYISKKYGHIHVKTMPLNNKKKL